MELYDLVIPFGILTLFLLTITMLMGLKVIRVRFKVHKVFGLLTFVSAVLHAGIILYLSYFE